MDSMEFNKIAGAVLAALLLIFGGSVLIQELTHHKELEQPGYDLAQFVTMPDPAAVAPAEEEAKPIFEVVQPLLASASVEAGQRVFNACKACHSVNEGGANKIGPNLWNIVGRDIGADDSFKYSNAMAGKEGDWSFEALAGFLHKPKTWLPGTAMGYAGIRKPEDVASMLAYLRSLSDSPKDLPAEAPSQ
ncbi:MAG: cytochrome c family protein [Pseudomonadota bacterium]